MDTSTTRALRCSSWQLALPCLNSATESESFLYENVVLQILQDRLFVECLSRNVPTYHEIISVFKLLQIVATLHSNLKLDQADFMHLEISIL